MEITEIRIMKKDDPSKKLKAFANVTFDGCFVVRDMKVVEGSKGLFVAMPSRRSKVNCPKCNHKNNSGSKFCSFCGAGLPFRAEEPKDSRQSDHKDIAHPVTIEFREKLQNAILEAYQKDVSVGEIRPREAPPRSRGNSEERPSMTFPVDED